MRNVLFLVILGATAVGASAQVLHGYYTRIPASPTPPTALVSPPAFGAVSEIPMWTYSVTASADLGGGTYSGQILGRSPFLPGKTTTTISLQIIPLRVVINNGPSDTHTYDASVNDGCEPAGHTAVDIVQNSPVFTVTPWTMDGVNVGTTQYHDAFYRASFWSLVAGTSYHFKENVTVLAEPVVYFGSVGNNGNTLGPGTNYNVPATFGGGCGFMGVVHINDFNNALSAVAGAFSPTVNIGTLPMVLADAVVADENAEDTVPDIFTNCCALGFHSGFGNVPNLQVTSIFDLDYSGLFGNQDVTVISHELGEAIFDPTGGNPTPVWGNIGQDLGNCTGNPPGQNNLEVGDPLSPNGQTPPATNEFVRTGANGLTYHLQELTFFSWFYGAPDLGIAGYYSDNGTFQGDAILCSNGGGSNGLNHP
jgi:hypothetical protein